MDSVGRKVKPLGYEPRPIRKVGRLAKCGEGPQAFRLAAWEIVL